MIEKLIGTHNLLSIKTLIWATASRDDNQETWCDIMSEFGITIYPVKNDERGTCSSSHL